MHLELRVLPGRFAVCRLGPDDDVPAGLEGGHLFSITRTAEELSLVCDERLVPPEVRAERGWSGLTIRGPLAFDQVGIVASVSSAVAAANVGIFVISTFDTDIILVPHARLTTAVQALTQAGHRVIDRP